jgi:membrane protein YdbS with pleckstrin-like domain
MNMPNEVLYQSPFVFLKKLIFIEVVFALIPVVLLLAVDIEKIYESIGFVNGAPFVLVWTLFVTLLQILAVSAAFLAWYLPRYVLDRDGVYFSQGPGGALKRLVDYSQISEIKVEQGALARRLGYGSILLVSSNRNRPITIKNVPDPNLVVDRLNGLAQKSIAVQNEIAPPKSVEELLADGESQFVEYKSSLMWDYRQQRINKKLYTPVMKSLSAFMNSRGGHLLIGVDDEGVILGIEADMQGMKKPNLDGWENTFNLAFNKMIGVAFRRLIELEFYEKDGRTVCHVFVHPADRPIFLKENNTEKFYVRAGNASQPLSFSEAATYIQARFRI